MEKSLIFNMPIFNKLLITFLAVMALATTANAAEHSHPAPEKLGTVHFENSCRVKVQAEFERAIALLHSFAYESAFQAFGAVSKQDPTCAVAHWGAAMSLYHPLWSPPGLADLKTGQLEIGEAQHPAAGTPRERELVEAAAVYFADADPAHHATRAKAYQEAMQRAAEHYPSDDEVRIFYALALLGTTSPTDRTHANQKRAAAILEPIYQRQPDHPGAAHYLIHAYDSSELAPRGLAAARAYAKIAPAAPHALHMPSHIFTRLGLWDDSIESNRQARAAAHAQGDVGEELHAMDYLTYAYLQRARYQEAVRVVADLRSISTLHTADFKVGYAATAMPIRLAVEREQWRDAASLEAPSSAPPQVAALAYWARALANARLGTPNLVDADVSAIDECRRRAESAGDAYWAAQIAVLSQEAQAWGAQAAGQLDEALHLLRDAADHEDALEKLPVTPGPVVPAREQLGQLLLLLNQPAAALQELKQALKDAPGRYAALKAGAHAAELSGDAAAADEFRRAMAAN